MNFNVQAVEIRSTHIIINFSDLYLAATASARGRNRLSVVFDRRVKSVLVQCPAGCMLLRFGWEWKFG
ncbi:hypothetical protein AGR4A_Cc80220 [Agrobacterium tumefaciens str. B6]|uniref:Uncharacterized protein n=2 Tax=Agrobacterium tumefaciens TaxID=358 RepID=A0A822V4P4_AGRTU|nr:hypothetical protein AGR4C_Cc80027 [Agrobacterium tumefaciens str. Kerr 14]CVI19900.1 hypothetical protein AGR4A_Cc80220 [Agrobacterium tumefaciens str. B6]